MKDPLDVEIDRSIKFVAFVAVIVPVAYMLWFWCFHKLPPSESPSAWGEFGDFIGGIVNPLIAYSAFYWLAKSVRLQKTELTETRKALEESQKAQEDQARSTLASTKLQFINIELEAINSQILAERAYVNQLLSQAKQHGIEYTVVTKLGKNEKLEDFLPSLNAEIDKLVSRRDRLIDKAKLISPDLDEQQPANTEETFVEKP